MEKMPVKLNNGRCPKWFQMEKMPIKLNNGLVHQATQLEDTGLDHAGTSSELKVDNSAIKTGRDTATGEPELLKALITGIR